MSLSRRRGILLGVLFPLGAGCRSPCQALPEVQRPAEEQVDPTVPEFPEAADFATTRSFETSFESEDEFAPFYVVPSPWLDTTWQELAPAPVASGSRSHHAWIDGDNRVVPGENTNHRGYPTVQLHRLGEPFRDRVRVDLQVWLDAPLEACADRDWFSFATFTSYADDAWYQVQLLNVDRDGVLHLMHVPTTGQSVHDLFQTRSVRLPWRTWVELTVLLDYTDDNPWQHPVMAAWQDHQLVSAARFEPRLDPGAVPRDQWPDCLSGWEPADGVEAAERACELDYRPGALAQAHFGLYAPPGLTSGEVYNDDLLVWEAAEAP